MAKISNLPRLIAPTGSETVVLLDGADTKRATLAELVSGVVAPVYAQRPTLGDIMLRTTVGSEVQNGAVAIPNGFTATDGKGRSSFLSYGGRVDDVAREMIPAGARIGVESTFAITAGAAEALGFPSAGFATRIVRASEPLGNTHIEGSVVAERSGFRSATTLVRTTDVTWYADIFEIGGLAQFVDVKPGFVGTFSVVLKSVVLTIDAVPAGFPMSAADLVTAIERERIARGYALRSSVGVGGSTYPSLAAAAAALVPASEQTRHRLTIGAFTDTTRIELPHCTDLIGLSPDLSQHRFTGAGNLTAATRVAHDMLLGTGTNTVENVTFTAEEANYCYHRESAGRVKNGVARIVNCIFRHNGNERSYAASIAAGAEDRSLRWVPAIGWGMSSGEQGYISRGAATSLKGGGVYIHNSRDHERPCSLTIEDFFMGGDDPVALDMTVSTLGSGTQDIVRLSNVQLSNGVIGYGVSAVNDDPLLCGADHADIKIIGRGLPPHAFMIGDDRGRALRIVAKAPTGHVVASAAGFERLIGLGYRQPTLSLGEEGRLPSLTSWYDVQSHSLGARLGDCRATPVPLTIDVGGQMQTITFDRDMTGLSNAAILADLNDRAMFCRFELVDVTARYRPTIHDQEAVLLNSGAYGIHLGAIVAYPANGTTCRVADESDFLNGQPKDPSLRFGIALQDIRRGAIGRVQVRGWISRTCTLATVDPNLGDGFLPTVVNGVHGVPTYAGNGSTLLRCIRATRSDGQGREVKPILLIG